MFPFDFQVSDFHFLRFSSPPLALMALSIIFWASALSSARPAPHRLMSKPKATRAALIVRIHPPLVRAQVNPIGQELPAPVLATMKGSDQKSLAGGSGTNDNEASGRTTMI